MKTPYQNYHNRPCHRFSILWSDDGFGNLIRTEESIDMIVYFVNGGFGIGGL